MKIYTPEEVALKIQDYAGLTFDGKMLRKEYLFANYLSGISFVGKVGEIAESLDHHPDILIQHRKVELSVFTHSYLAITDLDFELIKKVDKLYAALNGSSS